MVGVENDVADPACVVRKHRRKLLAGHRCVGAERAVFPIGVLVAVDDAGGACPSYGVAVVIGIVHVLEGRGVRGGLPRHAVQHDRHLPAQHVVVGAEASVVVAPHEPVLQRIAQDLVVCVPVAGGHIREAVGAVVGVGLGRLQAEREQGCRPEREQGAGERAADVLHGVSPLSYGNTVARAARSRQSRTLPMCKSIFESTLGKSFKAIYLPSLSCAFQLSSIFKFCIKTV